MIAKAPMFVLTGAFLLPAALCRCGLYTLGIDGRAAFKVDKKRYEAEKCSGSAGKKTFSVSLSPLL